MNWENLSSASVWLRRPDDMQIAITAQPVIAVIAEILILAVPRLLGYVIAIYLILFGILGLVH
jgi:hypothetical protein